MYASARCAVPDGTCQLELVGRLPHPCLYIACMLQATHSDKHERGEGGSLCLPHA